MKKFLIITILLSVLFSCTDHRMKGHAHKDDSTDLLGTDKNNNGVRDDLESYLLATYKDGEWRNLLASSIKKRRESLGYCRNKNITKKEIENQNEIFIVSSCLGRSKKMDELQEFGLIEVQAVTRDLVYNTDERIRCKDLLEKRYFKREGSWIITSKEDCTKYKVDLEEKK